MTGGRAQQTNANLKTFGFGIRALKTHPELIPLAAILGAACVGVAAWTGYALVTKPDVVVNKSAALRFETIDPEKPQKLLNFGQEYRKIPELEDMKKQGVV